MRSSSSAVLSTLLVAILSVGHIPGSHADSKVVTLSGSGEKLMAKVAQMVKRGEKVEEKTAKPKNALKISPQAVCGVDTSLPSSLINVCKIHMQFPGGTYVCSGWVVSPNKVATAGHCILDESGYATAVYVKCGEIQRTVLDMATPSAYFNQVRVAKLGGVHWADGAVLRLNATLPVTIVPWEFLDGSCTSKTATKMVTVSGYPAVNSGMCHYDGVVQWWSPGKLFCKQDTAGFYRADIDSCGGGSGSVVYDVSTSKALGIFVAEATLSTGLCAYNLVTRILDNASGGVNAGQGLSIKALMADLP